MMEREDLQDFESMKKTAGWFKRTARGRPCDNAFFWF